MGICIFYGVRPPVPILLAPTCLKTTRKCMGFLHTDYWENASIGSQGTLFIYGHTVSFSSNGILVCPVSSNETFQFKRAELKRPPGPYNHPYS